MTEYKIYEFNGMSNVYVGKTPIKEQAVAIARGINAKHREKVATIKYYDEMWKTWMDLMGIDL